jgi:hypothetical protein
MPKFFISASITVCVMLKILLHKDAFRFQHLLNPVFSQTLNCFLFVLFKQVLITNFGRQPPNPQSLSPEGGKGGRCSTVFSCPLWGKDVRRTDRGLLQIRTFAKSLKGISFYELFFLFV